MAIKPPVMNEQKRIGVLDGVITAIINQFNPEDIYPEEYITKWIEKNVMSSAGGWYEMLSDKVFEKIEEARPGDAIHAALTSWAEANNYVRSKVTLDERRYG